jgi:hypothetical protein
MKKIAALVLFTVIMFFVLFVLVWVGAAIRCSDVQEQTEVSTKYSPLSGCYWFVGGKWKPLPWE